LGETNVFLDENSVRAADPMGSFDGVPCSLTESKFAAEFGFACRTFSISRFRIFGDWLRHFLSVVCPSVTSVTSATSAAGDQGTPANGRRLFQKRNLRALNDAAGDKTRHFSPDATEKNRLAW